MDSDSDIEHSDEEMDSGESEEGQESDVEELKSEDRV